MALREGTSEILYLKMQVKETKEGLLQILTGISFHSEGGVELKPRLPVTVRVRPMYTSDIENRRHRSLLEHRRIGVGKSPMSML